MSAVGHDAPGRQERIGAYRIVRRLGAGGMGEVFLAWDERLERVVALKRVRADRRLDAVRRERLRREARAIARLSHPSIVQIFDILEEAGETDGDGPVIVMEYVEGRTVADLLRDGPLPLGAAARLGAEVAAGLAAAHGAGLVHRDLKGGNVLVTPEGRVKVLDFGLAKPLAEPGAQALTDDGALVGTFRSMSPEQVRGEAADARSDLFSLGVLLYEMLTGASPFAAGTALETLRNVVDAAPRPLAGLRPEVPPELAALVEALLAKEPGHRPGSAAAVARALGAFATPVEVSVLPPTVAEPPPWPSSRWTAPTEAPPADRSPAGSDATLFDSSRWRPRPVRIAALALALALLGALAVWGPGGLSRWQAGREPLRVAVLRPALGPVAPDDGERTDLATSGLMLEIQRSLLGLDGVSPVDPAQTGGVRGAPAAVARAVAADEAIVSTVEVRGAAGRFALQRVRAADGAVLWAERIEVPAAPEDALVLANAVAAALRRAYPERRPREGAPDLSARAEDYAAFVAAKGRIDAGRDAWAPELERLEAIGRSSPRLLDTHLNAALLAMNLYGDAKEPGYLERAGAALERARSIAPSYPRLAIAEVRLAVIAGNWERAAQELAELERAVPGDVLVLTERARLAEARGRLGEAIGHLRQAVERRPAWRELLRLADLEARSGDVATARRDLERALELAPGHTWVLAELGELELLQGDLGRARAVYEELVAAGPQRSDLTNLGLVHFLQGDHDRAAARYREALALDPDHLIVLLNLADAELARGRRAEAAALYARALARLDGMERSARLQPVERTMKAQCLARLGRTGEAVTLALDAVQQSPEEGEVAYQAALVLALAGERASAAAFAAKAVERGVAPRWFAVPGFEQVRAGLPSS